MTQKIILIVVVARWILTVILIYFFFKEQTGLATRILLFNIVFRLEGSALTGNIKQWMKVKIIDSEPTNKDQPMPTKSK